jgi:hypothetical protein
VEGGLVVRGEDGFEEIGHRMDAEIGRHIADAERALGLAAVGVGFLGRPEAVGARRRPRPVGVVNLGRAPFGIEIVAAQARTLRLGEIRRQFDRRSRLASASANLPWSCSASAILF